MSDPFGPYGLPGFGAAPIPFQPGGYATLVSGEVVHTADQASKTIVYYTPDIHNAFPIIRNGTRHAVYFDEPRLVLSTVHVANGIYDVYGVERNGKGHLVSAPVWATVTAGSCARGTAASGPELARAGGMIVNRWGFAGQNSDGAQFVPPGEGCYLFSIFIDGSAGQVTCHRSYGSSRKWGVWNAYNRRPLYLKAGDATASWSYNTATIRASRNQSTNSLTVFQGLADEYYDLGFVQHIDVDEGANNAIGQNGIGWNSTTAISGLLGTHGGDNAAGDTVFSGNLVAGYIQVPSIGINVVTALENAVDPGDGISWFGGEDDMVLSAKWRG